MYVKINKSNGLIQYDNDVNSWEADIIFLLDDKEVILLGTSHRLNDEERSNIITEILNKYFFRKLFKSWWMDLYV